MDIGEAEFTEDQQAKKPQQSLRQSEDIGYKLGAGQTLVAPVSNLSTTNHVTSSSSSSFSPPVNLLPEPPEDQKDDVCAIQIQHSGGSGKKRFFIKEARLSDLFAFASSLDQAGPFTRNVADSALMLSAMAGHDAKDSTSAPETLPDLDQALQAGVKGMKVGIPAEYQMDGMDAEIVSLWQQGQQWLVDAGAELVEISLPHTSYALPTYYIIAPAEASSNLARYDGVRYGVRAEESGSLDEMYEMSRQAGFGDEVQRRIMIGTYALSAGYYDAYYKKAQQVRWLIRKDFEDAFAQVDTILTPATPTAAFALGQKQDDPLTMYLNDVFTVPANLAGIPGISVPAGLSQAGLPLGLQLLAGAFQEDRLYAAAACLEKQAGFSAIAPKAA